MSNKDLNDLDRLLLSAKRGDSAAKDQLFRGLHAVATRAVKDSMGPGSPANAVEPEDLAGEAMVDLVAVFDRVEPRYGVNSVICLVRRIARLKVAATLRFNRMAKRDARRATSIDRVGACESVRDPEPDREAEALLEWIRRRCGDARATAVRLRSEGHTTAEVAALMGLHKRTVGRMIEDVRAAVVELAARR